MANWTDFFPRGGLLELLANPGRDLIISFWYLTIWALPVNRTLVVIKKKHRWCFVGSLIVSCIIQMCFFCFQFKNEKRLRLLSLQKWRHFVKVLFFIIIQKVKCKTPWNKTIILTTEVEISWRLEDNMTANMNNVKEWNMGPCRAKYDLFITSMSKEGTKRETAMLQKWTETWF